MSEVPTSRQNRLVVGLCLLLLVALVCGAIGVWVFGSLRQQRAVGALGPGPPAVSILYGYELDDNFGRTRSTPPPGPAVLRAWLGIDFFDTVRSVQLLNPVRDVLEPLQQLTGVRDLTLIGGYHVDDEFIERLKNLQSLEKFTLDNSPITARGLAILAHLPRLRILELGDCQEIDDNGLAEIGQMSGLTSLYLAGSEKVTTAGLAQLNRLTKLESLQLEMNSGATDAALESLQSLPHLHSLTLIYEHGGSAGGWKYLDGFTRLEELTVFALDEVSDADLAQLARLPKLNQLLLSCSKLTDAGLKHLAGLKGLKVLTVQAAATDQFSPEALAELRAALPACLVEFHDASP